MEKIINKIAMVICHKGWFFFLFCSANYVGQSLVKLRFFAFEERKENSNGRQLQSAVTVSIVWNIGK